MANNLPIHIGLIPDGNRRWADMKGVPHLEGHRIGADRMHQVVEELMRRGIRFLTVWGFSTDNWKRSPEEVQNIFALLQLWIEKDTPWLHANGVRLKHIGRFHELPVGLQQVIGQSVALTKYNSGLTLNLAFNYTGRADIVNAIRRLTDDGVPSELVDEQMVSRYLYTDGMPDVDLVIRTADEYRLSNFMLWQTAYSEFYFSDKLWPDFDAVEMERALNFFADRKRRFGGD